MGNELAYRKALLRMRVGDIAGAHRSMDKIEEHGSESVPGRYDASGEWKLL